MNDPVFPEWRDRPLDEALIECRELVESPDFETVSRWRDAGGKVVGHFQVYCPEEIIHAAGMLPLKIRGAPLEPTQADSRFGSYLCSILTLTCRMQTGFESANLAASSIAGAMPRHSNLRRETAISPSTRRPRNSHLGRLS